MTSNRYLLIIASLCISVLLWFNLHLYKSHTATIDLPVQYLNRADTSSNFSYPSRIKVRVSGMGINIMRMHFSNLTAYYDFKNLLIRNEDLETDNFQIDVPTNLNLDIIEVLPFSVSGDLHQSVSSVELPINLIFADDVAEELYKSQDFQLNVDRVEVKGSSEYLSSLKVISSQSVTAKMLSRDRVKVKLTSPNPGLMLSTNEVYLTRNGTDYTTRVFSQVPITSKPNESIFPTELTIWLKGSSSSLAKVRTSDLKISLIEAEPGKYNCEVSVPESIELLDYSPKFVKRIDK